MPAPSLNTFHTGGFAHSRSWALLALLAVALSGVAPLLLLAGRASVYADMELVRQWFTPILVLHVNLSVGLWFLAMTMALLRGFVIIPLPLEGACRAAAGCFLAAILCMAMAPLAGGEAFTSNYIPVQHNIPFFLGLGFAFAALLLMVLVVSTSPVKSIPAALCCVTALTLLVALSCFAFSVIQHPQSYGGESFYESVFWAGGHQLQFVYMQSAMLAWLMLAGRLKMRLPSDSWIKGLFLMLWLTALASLGIYLCHDVESPEHAGHFTQMMYWITGPVPAVLALWLIWRLPDMRWREHRPAAGCLLMSLALYFFGGALGFLIEGSNVTIPAHYHGSTVGVTLALMGVFYLILPEISGASVREGRLAALQPWIYGIGQILHVAGMAVAGGHNIARKTSGSLDAADQGAALALQIMRIGGAIAVIGGGIFVYLCLHALLAKKPHRNHD